jgi:transcriptional regulator with XRE-family HTH domain
MEGERMDSFGDYVKNLRMQRRLSLRAFSEAVRVDPANYSKIERGLLTPPRDGERLAAYEKALGLAPGSEESRELRRRAALDRGELPPAVLADPELMARLPALFRTLEGDPVNDELLDDLIETLRKE